MNDRLFLLKEFLQYRWTAKTAHGVHSPFVFEFINAVLRDRRDFPAFGEIAELRRKLLEEPTWPEDVPEVSGAECPDCGWPRVQAQREGYPLKAEVARLTRELAEARDTARKDNKRYEELLDRLDTERDRRITANQEADAARAEAARLREALEFYAHGLDGGRRARRALGQEGA